MAKSRKKIGLLGGSFNPAHIGHRQISLYALRQLQLDEIWWLISPQNPLKPVDTMAPLRIRVAKAKQVARHKHIKPTTIESQLGTRYTIDTITALQKKYPAKDFVWIMGSDNLQNFDLWKSWRKIAQKIPLAVIARPPKAKASLRGKSARFLSRYRIEITEAASLAGHKTPSWVFLEGLTDTHSATQIRAKKPRAWWL